MRSGRLIFRSVVSMKHVFNFGVRHTGRMQMQDHAYNLSRYFHGPWEDGMVIEANLPRKKNTYDSKGRDNDNNERYKMDHKYRGKAIIINNVNFDKKLNLDQREGSGLDVIKLKNVLKDMHFEVTTHKDLTADKMKSELKKAAQDEEYNRDSDCFVCVLSSHGVEGELCGVDETIPLRSLLHPFKSVINTGLHGKPKLFFIQACRGSTFDYGVKSENTNLEHDSYTDINERKQQVAYHKAMHQTMTPTDCDFLIGYSVAPGYRSVRDKKNGSWFLQALSKALREHWRDLDLLSIMTKVNQNVAENYTAEGIDHDVKEIPCITSMLTKKVLFEPKSKL